MKYLVTSEEMKRYDANTIDKIGISSMVLMERAALTVLEQIEKQFADRRKEADTLVLVGMGNNGGDGLALARLLCEQEYPVTVVVLGDESKASVQWRQQRNILSHYPVKISSNFPQKEYTILIDAMFGIGLSREITGIYAEAIAWMNRQKGYRIALDIPSGIDADNGCVMGCAVTADLTVTFGFCKAGLVLYPGCEYAGEVVVTQIGISEKSFMGHMPRMFCYDEPMGELLPSRERSGNKGTFGKVLVIAGSENMAGAAFLSAKAAYRAGAGIVKVITPALNRVMMQECLPEALLGTEADLEEGLQWADVVLIGPGLGQDNAAYHCLQTVIEKSALPLIIDADGLNLLAVHDTLRESIGKKESEVILTPHVGELSRLMNQPISVLKKDLPRWGKKLAQQLHCVVAAKDARTFVCKEDFPICVNIRGNSGMATAGSGDVLAGIIVGLLAQKMDAFRAAGIGVYLHAAAGEQAAMDMGEYALLAGDIVEALGRTIREGNKEL